MTVAWKKVCPPIDIGGLGIRDLKINNSIFQKKFVSDVMSKDSFLSLFLRSQYFSFILIPRKSGVLSSIWLRLKQYFTHLLSDCCWIVGDNSNLRFWSNN